MSETEREEAEPTLPTHPKEGKRGESSPDDASKGLDYVFKIAPADPKNSFDFEDVADK